MWSSLFIPLHWHNLKIHFAVIVYMHTMTNNGEKKPIYQSTHVITKYVLCVCQLFLFLHGQIIVAFIFVGSLCIEPMQFFPCGIVHIAVRFLCVKHMTCTTFSTHNILTNLKSDEMIQKTMYLNAFSIFAFLACLYIKMCTHVKQSVFHVWRNSIIYALYCAIYSTSETQDTQQRNTTLTDSH